MDEATSTRVVRQLKRAGWTRSRAIKGGWAAWNEAGLPVEQKEDFA